MTPLAGNPVVTAAQMRAAEAQVIADGGTVEGLMERAGLEIARAVRRLAGANAVLVLCGPGNNGGDGYVAARLLAEWDVPVRVAALGSPATGAARTAQARWRGMTTQFADAAPAPIVVDALFGTGMARPLESAVCDRIRALTEQATLSIAVDLPSGVDTDDGRLFGDIPRFDVTLALGAAKPAHLLNLAAGHCGNVRILDIGVPLTANVAALAPPPLRLPGAAAHKYNRGMVVIVGGEMPGAATLAAIAALRSGVGYILLLADERNNATHAIVIKPYSPDVLANPRIGALLIGPGLGRGDGARTKLEAAIGSAHPLVLDGDALHLCDPTQLRTRAAPVILTPHAGEFDAMFGTGAGSKIDRARAAAHAAGAVVVFKGADTVIADPNGAVRIALGGNPWLSTAGTGDVLAGAISAMLAADPLAPFEAACAGVWLHGEAARRLSGSFIADDLAAALSAVRGSR